MNLQESVETPNFLNSVEEEFHNFLLERGRILGFGDSKRLFWANYMRDVSRARKTIQEFFDTKPTVGMGDRALDIGCGCGNLLIALQVHFNQVYGIDINHDYVEWARKRAGRSTVVCADAMQLPWPDRWFDIVFSTDMLEHVEFCHQEQIAAEFMRVLKPGGWGVILVPNRFQILDEHNRVLFGTWLPPAQREGYVRAFSKNQHFDRCWERTGVGWRRLFERQGFQVMMQPHFLRGWNFLRHSLIISPNRYKIYVQKPVSDR